MNSMKLLFIIIIPLLLNACSNHIDYTPTEKSMVNIEEKVFVYPLSEPDFSIQPYAWDEIENDLAFALPTSIKGIQIMSNRAAFAQSADYKKLYGTIAANAVNPNQISMMVFDDTVQIPTVHVVVSYKSISYPERCPDWRHSAVINYDNSVMSNHGCATAINLGHMLADKNHLLKSVGDQRPQTESSVMAVENYYRAEIRQDVADELSTRSIQ